jgi:cell wall-associated NlpC family hydrolase
VTVALSKVGDDYKWGDAGPDTFDCSGLTMYSWRKAGVSLPHSSASQYSAIKQHVRYRDLEPGDLVFFYKPISHVGMYIGHGEMVHAENQANGITVSALAGYYRHHLTGAARPA